MAQRGQCCRDLWSQAVRRGQQPHQRAILHHEQQRLALGFEAGGDWRQGNGRAESGRAESGRAPGAFIQHAPAAHHHHGAVYRCAHAQPGRGRKIARLRHLHPSLGCRRPHRLGQGML